MKYCFLLTFLAMFTIYLEAESLESGNYEYIIKNDEVIITKYNRPQDSSKKLVIPSKIDNKNVVAIADKAFLNTYYITKIVIPTGVKKIGKAAFAHCYSLKSITFPNTLEEVGDWAFAWNFHLVEIKFADKSSRKLTLGNWVFASCVILEEVTLPNYLTTIGKGTFIHCLELTRVEWSASLHSISNKMFAFCLKLTEIKLGGNVKTIEYAAFSNCRSLKAITFQGETKVADEVFENCSNLKKVNIITDDTSKKSKYIENEIKRQTKNSSIKFNYVLQKESK